MMTIGGGDFRSCRTTNNNNNTARSTTTDLCVFTDYCANLSAAILALRLPSNSTRTLAFFNSLLCCLASSVS